MTLINRSRTFFRRTFRGLWRSRDFRQLWLSLTITSFGAQITNLALPLTAALLLNATPMQMGILVALETLPFALVSLHAGVLLDRVRKLPVIIFADIGRGLALLVIPIAAWFGSLSMEILFAVGFLCGVQNVVGGAAYQVLLAQMAGRKRLVEANAKVALGETSAALIGPGLAGGLIHALMRSRFLYRRSCSVGSSLETTCPIHRPVRAYGTRSAKGSSSSGRTARCGVSPGSPACGNFCITCRSRC